MKKLLSLLLCFILVFSFSACDDASQYKQVKFEHSKYFLQGLRFEIPNEWVYTELEDDTLFVFKNIGTYYGIGTKITDKDFEKIDKESDAKKIKTNIFIVKDNEHKTIYAKSEDEILKIEFTADDIENKLLNRLAKSIEFYDIKSQNINTPLKEEKQPEITDTIDLSFLETAEASDIIYPIETIYATYNSLNTVAPLFEKEWIGQRIGFLTMSNVAYFSLVCDDGYHYRFVENYTTNKFELWRTEYSEEYTDNIEFYVMYQKPLPENCNLVTTWHQFMIKDGTDGFMTLKEAEEIIETANLFEKYNKSDKLGSYETDDMYIKTEFYIPEVMAYFHVTENYSTRTAYYGLSGVNDISDHIPKELWKFNVSKDLAPSASIENYKKAGFHFDN